MASGPVLIVEYNTWLRLVLARLFTDLGYSVATASNGCAGLRLARELQPRVAILGDRLPELSTETLADALRKGSVSVQSVDTPLSG